MKSAILVINCGSSSIKFAVIAPESEETFLSGIAERLGTQDAILKLKIKDQKNSLPISGAKNFQAIDQILLNLENWLDDKIEVVAVGHRVVHGGEFFERAAKISGDVIASIEKCSTLAPLHNPLNLEGIMAVQKSRPDLPQVAVFDTAFHQTLPNYAYLYAIPYKLYREQSIRRYGFHGTSHQYVSKVVAQKMGLPKEELGIITLHLGNGCSATAIQSGISVDTTMGLSPLEGMAMGTRSGNVDPDLHRFLHEQLDMDFSEISDMFNRSSGLLGISDGISNDMRTLSEAAENGEEGAQRAIDLFCYRVAKSVMEMTVALEKLNAIVFTGGIGENACLVRTKIIDHLSVVGLELSPVANAISGRHSKGLISSPPSRAEVWVIPTNEELMIAQQTYEII